MRVPRRVRKLGYRVPLLRRRLDRVDLCGLAIAVTCVASKSEGSFLAGLMRFDGVSSTRVEGRPRESASVQL